MRFHHTFLFLFACLFSVSTFAYELMIIQAVSKSGRTFITRNGKRHGVQPGHTATFTVDDVSIIAKAKTVTGQFTQWEINNKQISMPFPKDAIVTMYPAKEYIWALSPEKVREKYIRNLIPIKRHSMIFRGSFGRGLSESVSDTPANGATRGSVGGEIFYERDIRPYLAWDVGLRFDREAINYESTSFITNRAMLITNVLYYFKMLEDYVPGRFYVGFGLGVGYSTTEIEPLVQSGTVAMLPGVKLGLTYPLNREWEFLVDGALESLQTTEEREDSSTQTTTQMNFRTTFGFRKLF